MKLFARTALLLIGLSLFVAPAPSGAAPSHWRPLSQSDKQIAFTASKMSVRHLLGALRWLQRQSAVERAVLGLDHRTVQIQFRDGGTVALLPRTTKALGLPWLHAVRGMARPHRALSSGGRAVVLEPFATDLGLGPNAGQDVVDLMTKVGFKVDVFRDRQVSVPVMEKLSDYAVVYMLTHSGVLDNGHALILLGETNQHPYDALLRECSKETPPICSVVQGIGQGTMKLSVAVTDLFVQRHMGSFSNSSIVFLNGCEILSAPAFVAAWHQKNVASFVGWDGKVDSAITEISALLLFTSLANHATVATAISDVTARGFGASVWDNQVTYLRQDGYGADTLDQALAGTAPLVSTPTTTPSPTPTATPQPTATKMPLKAKTCPKNAAKKHGKCACKKGYKLVHGKCQKVKKHR